MMILLPAAAAYFCIRAEDKAVILVAAAGALAGVLVCALLSLFSYMHRVPSDSFAGNFAYYALKEILIPCAAVYLVFFFTAKESPEFRILSFFPLTASFYAVYMPYFIIAANDSAFSFFELFAKPALVLCMLAASAYFVREIYRAAVPPDRKKLAVRIGALVLTLLTPPCIETLWLMNLAPVCMAVLLILYAAAAVVCLFLAAGKTDSRL